MIDHSQHLISDSATVKEALIALNNLSSDSLTLFVMNAEKVMVGTLTDGDIRRKLIQGCSLNTDIATVMNREFQYLDSCKIDVLQLKELRKMNITLIPLLNSENKLISIFNLKQRKSILPIDAVLMAGGKGERLRPLTEKTPKPLLPLGGKPIIDYNINDLINYGVQHINVTVNYLKEQIQEHFSTPKNNIMVRCVEEPCFLGTIGSVKFVEKIYHDYVLIMNSDLFTSINYEDFFVHFREHDADMSVAAVPYSITVPYGIFELDGRNVQGVKEKPSFNYYANAGIYLIKKEVLELIPTNQFFNATDLIDMLVKLNRKVIRFPITGFWIDIGKHEDYKKAQELAKHL